VDDLTFDRLVASIYLSASCAQPWEATLDQIGAAFSARKVFLHTADARDGRVVSILHGGVKNHDGVLEYVRTYHLHDPRRSLVLSRIHEFVGQWWHCSGAFDDDFVAGNRFYNDFMASYNARYTSSTFLAPGGESDPLLTAFAVELSRDRGPLSADDCEQIRRLGDHMLEALKINRHVRSLMAKALAGHVLLASFPYPMWLLDRDRGVSFRNAAAATEAEGGVRIAEREGRLLPLGPRVEQRLTEAMHALFAGQHGRMQVVDLRRTSADPLAWLHLSAIAPDAALGAFGAEPQVLATLFDPQRVSALDPFALSNMFGLTPAEARVAAALGDGLTATQIGDQMGTSESTVRTQIRQVLDKLAVPRIVDVVRVLRQGEALWARAVR